MDNEWMICKMLRRSNLYQNVTELIRFLFPFILLFVLIIGGFVLFVTGSIFLAPQAQDYIELAEFDDNNDPDENWAQIDIDLTLTAEYFKIRTIIANRSSVLQFNENEATAQIGWSEDIPSTRIISIPFNLTLGHKNYTNSEFYIRVWFDHLQKGAYPFDSYSLTLMCYGQFLDEGRYDLDVHFDTAYDMIVTDSNIIGCSIKLNHSRFEQLSSVLFYLLALIFAIIFLFPNTKINIGQKAGATITFIFTINALGTEGLAWPSLLAFYQMFFILFFLIFLALNWFISEFLSLKNSSSSILKESEWGPYLRVCFWLLFQIAFFVWNTDSSSRWFGWDLGIGGFIFLGLPNILVGFLGIIFILYMHKLNLREISSNENNGTIN
ncbi:MAG: hypothetical protein ACFFC7_18055 [Candidatus Hermodarchaeota archaeon]